MRPFVRVGTVACGVAVVFQAILLWAVTGRAGFTRYYDPARAARERAAVGAADLFADTGLEETTGRFEQVPNEFRLGLLPSGGGKHLLSMLTLAGPGVLAILLVTADGLRTNQLPATGVPTRNHRE
ncbi:MAG: hypothetical protein HY763_01660 [Planctomycetes bacterium]|nr:hypothetical protein [Planctomycetota bacterium]